MSRRAPCSRCRRQFATCELYKPSRRSSAPSSPARLHASACLRMRSRYAAVNRRRWAFAGTSGSGAVAADVAVGPKAPVALRAPSAFGPTTTSISTAGGMRFIHQTLPAPTLISIGRLSHRSLAQGDRHNTAEGRGATLVADDQWSARPRTMTLDQKGRGSPASQAEDCSQFLGSLWGALGE